MIRITILLLGLLAFVAACDSAESHRKLDLPRNEIAELHGIPSEFSLFGTGRCVVFTTLDGEPLQKNSTDARPMILDVLPGRHRVGLYFSLTIDGHFGPSGELESVIDARAGRIYHAELLHSDARGWCVEFSESNPE